MVELSWDDDVLVAESELIFDRLLDGLTAADGACLYELDWLVGKTLLAHQLLLIGYIKIINLIQMI